MKKVLMIPLLMGMISNAALSQENQPSGATHYFGYELGSHWLKEVNLIPKVHMGVVNGFTYRLELEGEKYHEVSFAFNYSKIKADLETEKVTQNGQINLGYSMGFNLLNREKVKYFLGFNARYSFSIIEFPVWDESRAYWATSISLGPANRLVMVLKENGLWITSWDISVLGLLSRPDEIRLYAQEDWSFFSILKTTHSDFKFGSIKNLFISRFRTEYRIHLKSGTYFAFSYSMYYSTTTKRNEHPLLITENDFGIGIGF